MAADDLILKNGHVEFADNTTPDEMNLKTKPLQVYFRDGARIPMNVLAFATSDDFVKSVLAAQTAEAQTAEPTQPPEIPTGGAGGAEPPENPTGGAGGKPDAGAAALAKLSDELKAHEAEIVQLIKVVSEFVVISKRGVENDQRNIEHFEKQAAESTNDGLRSFYVDAVTRHRGYLEESQKSLDRFTAQLADCEAVYAEFRRVNFPPSS